MMCHLAYLCKFEIILRTCLLSIAITHLLQAHVNSNISSQRHRLVKKNSLEVIIHTHTIFTKIQIMMLLIGGNYGGIFIYVTAIISTTTGGICGGIPIDFYSDIGSIDQLCSPVHYVFNTA